MQNPEIRQKIDFQQNKNSISAVEYEGAGPFYYRTQKYPLTIRAFARAENCSVLWINGCSINANNKP